MAWALLMSAVPTPYFHCTDIQFVDRADSRASEGGDGARRTSCTLRRLGPGLERPHLFGCGVTRRYGRTALKPLGKRSASSFGSCKAGMITTSSPSCQSAGVATLWLSVSCSESTTRKISEKFRPVLAG